MAGSAGVQLLKNAAASSTLQPWPGGAAVFSVSGTFAGATVKLQVLGPDAVTLIDAGAGTTLTAPGMGVAYLAPGQVQATVVGGPPSGINAALARIVGGIL